MSNEDIGAIILAAGMGSRMHSGVHKVLHPIGGRPMIHYLMDTLDHLGIVKRVVVVGADREQVEEHLPFAEFAVQKDQMGTAHAVYCAKAHFSGFSGDIIILYGDVPMVREETLMELVRVRRKTGPRAQQPAVSVLGFRPEDTGHYGRLLMGERGELEAIIEFKDATVEHLAIRLCNSGIMAVDGSLLFRFLEEVDNKNRKEEYYLTDIVRIARNDGHSAIVYEGTEDEVLGINSQEDLAYAEALFQYKKRLESMSSGVTLMDPETVYFSYDTAIENDVRVDVNVVFGPEVVVKKGAHIKSFSHLEGCVIEKGATIGPFARIRPGTRIGEGAKIGNFVETKEADIGAGAKISHLSYVGDALVGAQANIGAGTITCNYDGFSKNLTEIGDGAFIGSNTSLVAPVKIGRGAIVGAGSTITKNVNANALAVTRASQKAKEGWASDFRKKNRQKRGK